MLRNPGRFGMACVAGGAALLGVCGCFNVRAPERFSFTAPEIRVGADATDTPANAKTTSAAESPELRKAQAKIASLEKENKKLREKLDQTERELKTARKALSNREE